MRIGAQGARAPRPRPAARGPSGRAGDEVRAEVGEGGEGVVGGGGGGRGEGEGRGGAAASATAAASARRVEGAQ